MAQISVKNLKRVVVEGKVLNEFNAGINKPAFRSNGYDLVFDSSNQDHIRYNYPVSTTTLADVDFEALVYMDSTNINTNGVVFSFGSSGGGVGYLGFSVNNSTGGNTVTIIDGAGGFVQSFTASNFPLNKWVTVTFDGSYIRADGVIVNDCSTESGRPFGLLNEVCAIGADSNSFTSFNNLTLRRFEAGGTVFDLSEGFNNVVNGATITTSHASGVDYINAEMWQKRPFALEVDSANNEYLTYNYPVSTTTLADVDFEALIYMDSANINTNGVVFSFGSSGGGVGYLGFSVNNSTGGNTVTIIDGAGSFIQSFTASNFPMNKWVTVTFDGSYVRADGAIVNDCSTESGRPFGLLNEVCAIGADSNTFVSFNNLTLRRFEAGGTVFNPTEGLGNTTDGATITTSHASGVDRINYGMWLKSDGAGGWIPYT